jgi:ADP-ribose pyrophosphatase YjhB (NUDIX family)
MGSHRVVLSPHLDDAVLSCWHAFEAGDATVVSVFAGIPDAGTSGWWDRLTGSDDSAARVRERLREDEGALALAGASAVRLDLLDEQYRGNGVSPSVAEALADHVRDADEVYAPLGLFLGDDHRLVRDAALELRADTVLYADHPHAGIWGLPGWVTGDGGAAELDVDAAWRQRMTEAGLEPDSLRPVVHTLDADAFERKLAAVRAYRTQVPALEREAPFDQLRWEVTWTR